MTVITIKQPITVCKKQIQYYDILNFKPLLLAKILILDYCNMSFYHSPCALSLFFEILQKNPHTWVAVCD